MMISDIKKLVRDVPNFPKPGIIFKDITPVLKNPEAMKVVIKTFVEYYRNLPVDKIVSMESRGFIFGSIISYELGCGFVPVRKKGKLPYKTVSIEYTLEYGTDTLEIHEDGISQGDSVVIIDDVLATGGTAKAVIDLVKKCGGNITGLGFLIELTFLKPREKLFGYDIFSIIQY